MVAGRGGHELHICQQVCQSLRGDPLIGVLGVVVAEVHHQAVRGDKSVDGALIALVFGSDMIEAGGSLVLPLLDPERRSLHCRRGKKCNPLSVPLTHASLGQGETGHGAEQTLAGFAWESLPSC